MPLNSEAALLSNDYLAKGLLEDAPSRLQFLRLFPFIPIHGSSLDYARTPALDLAEPLDFCDPITEHTKLPNDPNVNFVMAELAAHTEVSYKGQDIFCETNDLFNVERELAIRELLYKFGRLFEDGDKTANPNEFDGLKKIVSPAQLIDKACTPLSINDLDKARQMVTTNQGQCGVIITNQTGYEFIRKAYYNVGSRPGELFFEVPNPLGGTKQQLVTAVDGWVVLINDQQADFTCGAPAKPAANIWFTVFGWDQLHGIIPDCEQDSMFQLRKTIRPDDSKDVCHIVYPVGIALGTSGALAGILNATEPPTTGGGGGGDCCDATLITVTDESAVAPNSRQLAADFAVNLTDGGAAAKIQVHAFDPFKKLAFVENFFFFDNIMTTLENNWIDVVTGGFTDGNFVADPGGIIRVESTSGVADRRWYLVTDTSGTGNQGPLVSSRNPRCLILARITTAGTGSRPRIHAGMANEAPASGTADPNPDSGIFFRVKSSDTNWIAVCRKDGVESTLDTGVAAADSVYRKLELVTTGTTSVEVFVDGVSKGTITTNIPTETMGLIFGGNTADEAAKVPVFEIDAIGVEQDVP